MIASELGEPLSPPGPPSDLLSRWGRLIIDHSWKTGRIMHRLKKLDQQVEIQIMLSFTSESMIRLSADQIVPLRK